MKVLVSTDIGQEVHGDEVRPGLSQGRRPALANIWWLEAGDGKKDLWCGVEPASLFRSRDGGNSWEKVAGITDHGQARNGSPAMAGFACTPSSTMGALHLGISTEAITQAATARRASRRKTPASALASSRTAFPSSVSACIRLRRIPIARSGSTCRTTAASKRIPSHRRAPQRRRRPELEEHCQGVAERLRLSDRGASARCECRVRRPARAGDAHCPEARPAVWRSESAGDKWQRLTGGLPKKDAWFTVLRDAMDIDDGRRPSVWFGTTTGQLWIGRDGGEEWSCLFDSLPPEVV